MEGWQVNGKWSKRKASCIGGWGDLSALVDDETLDLQPRTGKLSSSSRLCYNCFELVWKLYYYYQPAKSLLLINYFFLSSS